MPTYTAECPKCFTQLDYFRHLAEYNDVPTHCGIPMVRVIKAPQIMRDIEPYKAVAADLATGKPPVIGSRREHREFLERNNYFEWGTEVPKPKPRTELDSPVPELKRAIKEVMSK